MNSRCRSTTALVSGHQIHVGDVTVPWRLYSQSRAWVVSGNGVGRSLADRAWLLIMGNAGDQWRIRFLPMEQLLVNNRTSVIFPFRIPSLVRYFVRAALLLRKNFHTVPGANFDRCFSQRDSNFIVRNSNPSLSAFDKPARQPKLARGICAGRPDLGKQHRQRVKLKHLVDAAPELLAPRLRVRVRRARRQAAWSLASRTGPADGFQRRVRCKFQRGPAARHAVLP